MRYESLMAASIKIAIFRAVTQSNRCFGGPFFHELQCSFLFPEPSVFQSINSIQYSVKMVEYKFVFVDMSNYQNGFFSHFDLRGKPKCVRVVACRLIYAIIFGLIRIFNLHTYITKIGIQ